MDEVRDNQEIRPPGAPKWVKVLGIIVLVMIAVVVVVMIAGGGEHGPGRHLP